MWSKPHVAGLLPVTAATPVGPRPPCSSVLQAPAPYETVVCPSSSVWQPFSLSFSMRDLTISGFGPVQTSSSFFFGSVVPTVYVCLGTPGSFSVFTPSRREWSRGDRLQLLLGVGQGLAEKGPISLPCNLLGPGFRLGSCR